MRVVQENESLDEGIPQSKLSFSSGTHRKNFWNTMYRALLVVK